MTKPIQLRCLVGLLGFEPDVAKLYNDKDFDDAMQNFLETLDQKRINGSPLWLGSFEENFSEGILAAMTSMMMIQLDAVFINTIQV